VSGVHVYEPPVAVVVRTPTVLRSVDTPFRRVMVTGWVESPPVQVIVTGVPAATALGNEVKAREVV